jgi:hypothetical protein
MHKTKDRIKGPQGNKTYQTRRRSNLIYGEFCDTRCYNDWFQKYGTQAVNHFGRTTKAKHLTEENAWYKDYDWYSDYSNRQYIYRNDITKEQRPLTEEQYNDKSYNLNTGE